MNQLLLIGLGSNMGDRQSYLDLAIRDLAGSVGKLLAVSSFYESEPWGVDHKTSYINAVAAFASGLSPKRIQEKTEAIEKNLGRTSKRDLQPRTIDLDVLSYGDQVIKRSDFQIPHARLHCRRFVLLPLADVCPDWLHPEFKKTVVELIVSDLSTGWVIPLPRRYSGTCQS